MKQIIKKGAFVLLALAMVAPVSLLAQKDDKEKDKEKVKKETEQIVISRNGDKKIVVEVDGNKVTVNGKPLEDYTGGDVTVLQNRIKDLAALNGGYSQLFNNEGFRTLTTTSADANRPMLGVVTDKAEKGGAEIQSVTKDGGAEKAGLKKGDVITKVGDAKIETPDDLTKAIRAHKPGDKVEVTYLRDKKEQKASAELSKYKGVNTYAFSPGSQNLGMTMPDMMELDRLTAPRVRSTVPGQQFNWSWSGGNPKMGMSVQDSEDGKGVKVVDVDGESNASKAGIKENDVITEVDGQAVNNADEIAKIIRDSKDKVSVKMKLTRNGKSEIVEVKVPRRLKTADL